MGMSGDGGNQSDIATTDINTKSATVVMNDRKRKRLEKSPTVPDQVEQQQQQQRTVVASSRAARHFSHQSSQNGLPKVADVASPPSPKKRRLASRTANQTPSSSSCLGAQAAALATPLTCCS